MGRVSYSVEFRARAVRQVFDHSLPVSAVAESLGVKAGTLSTWLARARLQGVEMAGQADEDLEAEVARLRVELKGKSEDLF